VRRRALQCVAVRCSALQCVAVRCSVWQCVAVRGSVAQCVAVRCSAWQCVAMCCNALQCVAMRCNALQCVAVHCTDSCVKYSAALNIRIRALKLYIECTRYSYSIHILSSVSRARQKQNTSIYILSRKLLYKNNLSRGVLICMGGAEGETYSKLCKGASPRHVSSQIVIHIERKRALYPAASKIVCVAVWCSVLQCVAVFCKCIRSCLLLGSSIVAVCCSVLQWFSSGFVVFRT